ncbi:MAG TPA: hypothetical protein VFU94_14670 [Conexibacter sp.]|nr:hypothetical protein [Conexibacter sp.]
MPWHVIAELVFDEHNRSEMARHAVTWWEVDEVPWNRHIVSANPRGERGSVLLIGETDGGRLLTVPLAPTDDPTTWRPATAFDASRHHRALFDRRHR